MKDFKIAVYSNDISGMCSFLESNQIEVYQYEEHSWEKERAEHFSPVDVSSVALLRKSTMEIKNMIKDCAVIAGADLSGVPYSVFNTLGVHIFNIAECNEEILNAIKSDISEMNKQRVADEDIIQKARPVSTDIPGQYEINLIQIQAEYPHITSKIALMQFLNEVLFKELIIICKHVPPWIENDGRFAVHAESKGEAIKAKVVKASV